MYHLYPYFSAGSTEFFFHRFSLCSFYVSLRTPWFVTTYSIAFVLTSRVGRAKTRPRRPPHALSRAAQRLLLALASVGIPCCSAVFLLLFWTVSRRLALSPSTPPASSPRDDSNEPSLITRSLRTRHRDTSEILFFSPDVFSTVGSAFLFHGLDSATCRIHGLADPTLNPTRHGLRLDRFADPTRLPTRPPRFLLRLDPPCFGELFLFPASVFSVSAQIL
ncbi:hypothetical protein PIB30_013492 [Stylosanthes scabra]|uniref:Uncharacterized protein n=1 Tax=Stylosanthes scabra TaxID=79078 RepID=A0ABU6Z3Z8_9FABA|nr:hypothetical protein [Stylosanthes scabra]